MLAAAGLLLAGGFVLHFARGNSEGLLVALCLWAVDRHLDGRRTSAFLLGVAAGLLRPELWPFLLVYGLWLMWREPRRRWLVLGCGALTLALWLLPEWWGSGDPLRAAERARDPNPGSAAFAENPFMETLPPRGGRAHVSRPARGGPGARRRRAAARPPAAGARRRSRRC